MTGILFLIIAGLGRDGVPGGSSEEPVFCRVGSVGEPEALRFLRLWSRLVPVRQPFIWTEIKKQAVQPIRKLAESHSEIDFCFKSVYAN